MKLKLAMVRREISRSIELIERSRVCEVAKKIAIVEMTALYYRIKYGSEEPLKREIENQEVKLKGVCEQ